jgi:hypothetical protein
MPQSAHLTDDDSAAAETLRSAKSPKSVRGKHAPSPLLLVALTFLLSAPGCQSMQAVAGWMRPAWMTGRVQTEETHAVLPVHRQAAVNPEVVDHADVSVPGPDEQPVETEQTGFWSRLKAPSRFLLPRTDAWLGHEDTESSQSFDSGF